MNQYKQNVLMAIQLCSFALSGKLVKGSGSFKIDHPLDPKNRYLSHSFVESPDMMNIYSPEKARTQGTQ